MPRPEKIAWAALGVFAAVLLAYTLFLLPLAVALRP